MRAADKIIENIYSSLSIIKIPVIIEEKKGHTVISMLRKVIEKE